MIATVLVELLAAADDDGGSAWLLLLGPAGGVAVYFGMWRYYRNTHKSHSFERETRVEAQPVSGQDVKVKEISGTKRSRIDGDNRTDHRRRVQRLN
ncbi:MAG TPA: hypothetical protein VK860_14620 [Ilumatobacteraceae bacterium]|nr:hypothetical protein [Ilumatobacteraceae bacterium]